MLLALAQLIFCGSQIAQSVLPFLFQPASDKTILRIARFIAPLRALSLIMGAFDFPPLLFERRIAIGFELFQAE
jgi:hypothetical protein